MKVPNVAPMRLTSPPKTGMALAMMYESAVQPITVLSQTTQCLTVFLLRCGEFRRLRTNRYLAANCCQLNVPYADNYR